MTSFATVTLTLHETAIAIAACCRAGRVALVMGPPGVAKTTLINEIAPMVGKALGFDDYPPEVCVLSNREAVDIGGYPVVHSDNTVEQHLFGTLRRAAEHPCLLALDEFLTCSQSVQGPALRLTLERYAGEQPLHPGTRVVCAANPPDMAPGGIQLTAALVNRLIILHCQPTVAEVSAFFCGLPSASLTSNIDLPNDELYQERRKHFMDVAGILFESRPDMLCFNPTQASISGGQPFASPRAWQICCEVLAALPARITDGNSEIMHAVVLGILGPGAGVTFLSIMRAANFLPTVAELLRDPENAKLPDPGTIVTTADGTAKAIGRDINFAAIPLVVEAARSDTWATWVYVKRLPDEIRAAVAKGMAARVKAPPGTPWLAKGQRAMLEEIERLTGGNHAGIKRAS